MQLTSGFIDFDPITREPTASGPLDGLTFAIKDIFDISGTVTGLGQPEWRASHDSATCNAPAVDLMLEQGAKLVGKTHTDELCYSIAGQNIHYGTPPNPQLPDAIPGGSSSGSVSVVAAGLVNFALGSDTGGSIRVPASYCGVYGFRPTHDAIPMPGVAPLAPSFDTLGWFAPDIETLRRVGTCLLPESKQHFNFRHLRCIDDIRDCLEPSLETQLAELIEQFTELTRLDDLSIGSLERFPATFRVVQGYQAWQHYGKWIETNNPNFGPGIKERFETAARITEAEYQQALAEARALRKQLRSRLSQDTLLCLPTTPGCAPAISASPQEVDEIRSRTMRMTAIAGIAGLPQISIPALHDQKGPVGLSLIGPAGSDHALLALTQQLSAHWKIQPRERFL